MPKKITKATKDAALIDYINNTAISAIAKKHKVNHSSIKRWIKQDNWKEQRENAINESARKAPDMHQKIVEDQVEITHLANKLLLRTLKAYDEAEVLLDDKTISPIINVMKHGLEVVRPKTQAQFNSMQVENATLQITKEEMQRLMEVMETYGPSKS